MTDVLTKRQRSVVMTKVRSAGNRSTELRFVEFLRRYKICGWRRSQPLFGKPDFVFRAARVCVFVDGCFWHGCPRCYRRPESNREYWDVKLRRNRARDRVVRRTLTAAGWTVVRVWEHELKIENERRLAARIGSKVCP